MWSTKDFVTFILLTAVLSISRVLSDSNREKRDVNQDEQPRIITTDGHLLFQTGDNHNITFRTGTTGRVVIGDADLTEVIRTVKSNTLNVESLQSQVDELKQQIQSIQNELGGLTIRVGSLESGDTGTDPDLINQVNSIQSQLNSIETNLQSNECSSNPCQNGGTCTDLYNSFQCQCPDGWTGTTCSQDVNECSIIQGTPDACQNGGTCQNIQGSYRCLCTSDWYGAKCTIQYDDCTTASHDMLCDHGYCVNEPRVVAGQPKYSCICYDGWTTDSSSSNPACSVDVNECDDSPCFAGVTCTNVAGAYYCGNCPSGYTGNGKQCSDVNECLTNNGGCSLSPLVTCINSLGSRSCGVCPAGYVGDGVTCTYIGICNMDNGGCSSLATCVENSGVPDGRTCTCPDGYTGDGVGSNGCVPSSTSCSTNPCVYGRCEPDGGSYSCICTPGFTGSRCETNINECASNPCANGGSCVDGYNSYICNCVSGYSGVRCEESSQSCGGTYFSELGSFSFPGDGESYQHSATCSWTITTNVDKVLMIQFTSLKIEYHDNCDYDSVQLFDGPSMSSYPLSDRICGSSTPDPFTSTHNQVFVQFVSDSSNSGEGFTLSWSSLDPVCGGTLDDSNHGDISSPGYPGNYPNLRDCSWTVTVDAGRYITFAFASIDLETSDDCSNDYLEIYDGLNDQYTLLGQFCTSDSPSPIQTTGPYAFLRFHSNSANTGQGFHITYTSMLIDPGCGGAITDDSGVIISPNYPNDYNHNADCIWTIQVPDTEVILFTITNLEIEVHGSCVYDYVELRDGFDETAPFVGRYCDSSAIPPPFISSTNSLYVKFHSDASISAGGFRATFEVYCGGSFTEDNGEVVSPYFPNQYPHEKTCEYFITAGDGQGVQLTFVTLAIEYHPDCNYDYVEVRDGSTADTTLIGRYCGTSLPAPITSTGSGLYLKFATDGSVTNFGFRATYTFVDVSPPSNGCGGLFTDPTGIISSPVHPELYPHSAHCVYDIQVSEGSVVRLTFSFFSLEYHSSCNYDYVEIYDNSTTTGNALMGKYCGTDTPPVLTSTGNLMTVVFHSDSSVALDGFTANYVALNSSLVCGAQLTATTGVITSPRYPSPYYNNAECVWTIIVPSGQQISVTFTAFELEGSSTCLYDYLELRNGGYGTSPLIATLCGSTLPSTPYISHSNRMYIKFKTDGSVTYSGFSLSYDGTATGCGGTLTTPTGSFTSPNYPYPYDHNAECFWSITANQGHKITLMFTDFSLESHYSCAYDYVRVYDGPNESSNLIDTYCGTTIPPFITSTGSALYVKYRTDYSVSADGFQAMYMSTCEEVRLTARTGFIESANYPDAYPHGEDCSWVIETTVGNTINISFVDLDLEYHGQCVYDYIKVIDGQASSDTVLVQLCGSEAEGSVYYSTGNYLRIEFHTDASVANGGFQAYYVINGCGDDLTGNSGTFNSLNYPQPYEHSRTCEWTITVELGHSITLSIEDIDLEQSTSCQYDSLEIYTGQDDSGFLLAQLCSQQDQTQQVSTTGNQMYIRFITDESVNGGGFNATYVSNPGDCINATSSFKNETDTVKNGTDPKSVCIPGCGGNFSTPTGNIHSLNYPDTYPHNSDCSWLITVQENARVELTFNSFNLESATNCVYDYVKVYDGDSAASSLLLTWCGSSLPSPPVISSTNNTMFVRMYSDYSVAASGFDATYVTACGGRRDATLGGYINSPNFPSPYNGNQNCSWIIQSPNPTDRVTLTFVALDLETAPTGCYDYVQVLDGDDLDAPGGDPICGTTLPSPITSFGSSMVVNFISDGSNHGTGFRALYSTAGAACGGDFTAPSGTFTSPGYPDSYPQSAECVWTIVVSAGSRVQMSFSMFDIEDSSNCVNDFLEVREEDENGALMGRFCGSTPPSNLTIGTTAWIRFQSDSTGTAAGFVSTYQQVNGGDLSGSTGEIFSPNYPDPYADGLSVTWIITVDPSYFILITIVDVEIEGSGISCPYDYLRIFDGINNQAAMLAEICGSTIPSPTLTTGNTALVQFITDGSVTGRGFRLQWQQTTSVATGLPPVLPTDVSGCDQSLTATSALQNFTSPGYPDGYDNNLVCRYTISAPPTRTVMLNFTDLRLEDSTSCRYDSVKVYDGPSDTDALLGNYCGRTSVEVYSTTQTMLVIFASDASVTSAGFFATYTSHCGGTFRSPSGTLTSPGYPSDYPADSDCTYIIETTIGSTISVTFSAFLLEDSPSCTKDSITIFNGGEEESPPLGSGTYCGSTSPGTLDTTSNKLRIRFVSDGSGSSSGFSLTYTTVVEACGGAITLSESLPSGTLTSPNYPSEYDQNTDCQWTISSPAGTFIGATFASLFYIEAHASCQYDYVEIRDGSQATSDLLGKFCGTTQPPSVKSTGNAMFVRFRTDSSVAHAGFSLTYGIAQCGGRVSGSSGTIRSPGYPGNYNNNDMCEWIFEGLPGHFLTVSFPAFDLQQTNNCSADYVVIHDGRNQSDPLLGRYCGSDEISDVDTSSNIAYVKFATDDTFVSTGFMIQFTSSQESCGGDLQTPTGTLQSPSYPQNYDHSRICEWRITVQEGYSVNLYFLDLDIEVSGNCIYDFVAVYNGLEDDAPLIDKYCGTSSPDRVSSSGNTMRVVFQTDASVNGRGFQARYDSQNLSVCGETIQTTPPSTGYITSPGYGQSNYSNDLSCDWMLSNTNIVNSSLQISFDDPWGLEGGTCIHDYVEIRSGVNAEAPLIGRYCGDSKPLPISSPWNTLFIRFRTDSSVVDTGFRLKYQGTDCGGILTSSSGVITSPNFPAPYRDEDHCAWLIQAPEGSILVMTFSNFSIESHEKCNYDYLMIKNGGSWDSPSISGEFGWCDGNPPPHRVVSSSNEVMVIFSTDQSASDSGFRMEYTTNTAGCGGIYQGNTGAIQSDNYPNPYPANEECIWIISVETGYNVILTFDPSYNLGSGDTVKIYDGTDTDAVVIQTFTSTPPTAPVQSSFPFMTVKFRSDGTNQGTGFMATWSVGCGGNLTAQTGRITSQGYPTRSYDNNANCEYVIEVDTGDSVLIFFDDRFDLEDGAGCSYDSLSFYDGRDNSGTLLGQYCGSTVPDQIENIGPVFVAFMTDDSITRSGFGFSYEPGCGGLYTEDDGTLGTPTHLDTYKNSQNCTWSIRVSEGKSVQLRFTSFQVEYHVDCNYDHLVIYDGEDFSADPLTARLCGDTLPDQLTSSSNSMFINFVTDTSVTQEGFQATYQAVYGPTVGCGGTLTGGTGTIQSVDINSDGSYEPNLDCMWYITIPDSSKVVQFDFSGVFQIEPSSSGCTFDYIEIHDGINSYSPLVGFYCGTSAPSTITLSSSQAFVRFVSDSSVNQAGFTLTYSSADRTCGGQLNATSAPQVLKSPNYPNDYPHNARCSWVITATESSDKVRLITTAIDIEAHTACNYDYVQFSDFPMTATGQSVHYCGQTLPPSFDSVDQTALVYFVTDLNSAGAGFSLTYLIADCNQNLTETNGRLTSPGYPRAYNVGHNCTTRLTSPAGSFLTLYFDDFELETSGGCIFDYLRIRDGPSPSSTVAFFSCGIYIPDPIFGSSNEMYLEFYTDSSINFAGYAITYTSSSVSSGCGGPLTGTSGTFASPSYPNEYPANLTCEWAIEVPARRQPVSLEFTVFKIEGQEGVCSEDYVEVYQGTATTDPLIGRYCGTNIPAVITATTNVRNLLVRFITNSENAGDVDFTGFRAKYSS